MVAPRAHDERWGVVRRDPMIGLAATVVVLAGLAATVGLGLAGWVAGLTYALVAAVLLQRGLSRSGTREFGPADWVTLTRMSLVGGVAALTTDAFQRIVPVGVLVSIAVAALLLDWVDGQVARRTGTASEFGARFDMEVDSFLLLVLSVYAARSFGAWVLVFGGMRYAFGAAGWMLPWMRAQLPPRYWRKVVATSEGVVLVLAVADVLPRLLTQLALVAAMGLLLESFGRDVLWLWKHRPVSPGGGSLLRPAPDRATAARRWG
jgi:phosphatidylglycerophosphate synthase